MGHDKENLAWGGVRVAAMQSGHVIDYGQVASLPRQIDTLWLDLLLHVDAVGGRHLFSIPISYHRIKMYLNYESIKN